MSFSSWWHKVVNGPTPRSRPDRRRTRRPRGSTRRLQVEQLEDRRLLAVNLASSFVGLSSNDVGGGEPPDTNMAVGLDRVVEMVNTSLAIYDKMGTQMFSTDLHAFFNKPGSSFLSDPVVTYDDIAKRFVVAILSDIDPFNNTAMLSFAISTNASPSKAADFEEFHNLDFTELDPSGGTFAPDYPRLGYNADAYVFSFNMFGTFGFDHVQIATIDKSSVMDGDPAITTTQGIDRTLPTDFTMAPATMHGAQPGDPMWFVESLGDGNGGTASGNTITVTRMDNVLTAVPTLTDTVLTVPPYLDITGARQPVDPAGPLTSQVDGRILNSAWRANRLVADQIAGFTVGPNNVARARWYDIDVAGAPRLTESGNINQGATTYTSYPAIDIAPSGSLGMSFLQSSNTQRLSMYVTARAPGDPVGTMQTPVLVNIGLANYTGARTGDYSGISVDPVDGSFWAANEFANADPSPNWGTAVANFDVPAATHFVVTAPATVTAGVPFNVTVMAEDAMGNQVPYVGTVSFTSSDLLANLPNNYTFKVFENGQHTFTIAADRTTLFTAGTQTITVTDTIATTLMGTATINVNPAAATKLAFGEQPANTVASAIITPAVTVFEEDQFGNIETGDNSAQVTLAIGANPSGGTLSGTSPVTVVGGVATFSDLSIDKVGKKYTFVATSSGLTSVTSNVFDIVLGTPDHLTFFVQPSSSLVAGVVFSPAVVVRIEDKGNNVVATDNTDMVSLAIGANPGGGTLSGTTTHTVVNGVATFNDLSIQTAGVGYTLVATSLLLPLATSNSFTIVAAAAVRAAISAEPTDTTAGMPIDGPTGGVVVQLLDRFNNVILGDNVSQVRLEIQDNPAGGTLGGTKVETVVAGVATFPDLSIDKAGVGYTLSATVPNLRSDLSTPFTIIPDVASHMVFGVQPSLVGAGLSITPAVTVRLLDHFDNLVTIDSSTAVTMDLGLNPGGATLMGTLTQTATAGVVTFDDLSLDKVGTGYTLHPSSGTLTATDSAAFDVTVGAPDHLLFDNQPTTTGAGAFLGAPTGVTLKVYDRFGNFVNTDNTDTVSIALFDNPGGSTLGGATTVTVQGGVATFGDLTLDKVATGYTLQATSTLGTDTSLPFDITVGAPDHVVFDQQPTNAIAGDALNPPVTVRIFDRFDNFVATDNTDLVTLGVSVGPTGEVVGGTATVTALNGVATFDNVFLNKVGTGIRLRASSGTLGVDVSTPIDITFAAPDHLAFGVQPSQTVAGVAISPAVTVREEDRFGNLISDANVGLVSIGLAATPTGGTLSGTRSQPLVNGIATFDDLSVDKAQTGYRLVVPALGGLTGVTSTTFSITPAAASHFGVVAPASSIALSPIDITVTALDRFNNTDTNFTGTVALTSSDPAATLPGSVIFDSSAAGVKVLSSAVTLNTAGNQTVTATQQPAGITGTSDPIAVSNPLPTLSSISVTSAVESTTPVTVTVMGTNFVMGTNSVAGTVVQANGVAVQTNVISSTQLSALVPVTEEGTVAVTVFSPTPGGGTNIPAQNKSITVSDAALRVDEIVPVVILQGVVVPDRVLAEFTDLGGFEGSASYAVSINWGDGTPQDTTGGHVVQLANGALAVQGTHTYPAAGRFTPTLTVTDEGGQATSLITTSATIGSLDDRYVSQIYLDLLGRRVDPQGLSFWSGALDAGLPKVVFVQALQSTIEYKTNTINNLYQTILGRPVDPAGLNLDLQLMNGTALFVPGASPVDQIRAILYGSDEYFLKHGGNNTKFLQDLYQSLFGRAIDAQGAAFFGNALNGGTSRTVVARMLLSSLEGKQSLTQTYYQKLVHHGADSAGLNFWSNVLIHGGSENFLVLGLALSPDYSASL